jgi:hypothetical protein
MKNLITLFITLGAACLIQTSALADTIRLSEPLIKDPTSETFGEFLDTSLDKVSLTQLVTQSSAYLSKPFLIETKIAKVCQKKGCFFIAQQNEHVMRVSFKDYGFFIPTNSSGKTVLMTGELIQKQMSPEQAKHFASDLNEDAGAIKPGLVFEIVANSIQIPLS